MEHVIGDGFKRTAATPVGQIPGAPAVLDTSVSLTAFLIDQVDPLIDEALGTIPGALEFAALARALLFCHEDLHEG